jgi:hypothetical protein
VAGGAPGAQCAPGTSLWAAPHVERPPGTAAPPQVGTHRRSRGTWRAAAACRAGPAPCPRGRAVPPGPTRAAARPARPTPAGSRPWRLGRSCTARGPAETAASQPGCACARRAQGTARYARHGKPRAGVEGLQGAASLGDASRSPEVADGRGVSPQQRARRAAPAEHAHVALLEAVADEAGAGGHLVPVLLRVGRRHQGDRRYLSGAGGRSSAAAGTSRGRYAACAARSGVRRSGARPSHPHPPAHTPNAAYRQLRPRLLRLVRVDIKGEHLPGLPVWHAAPMRCRALRGLLARRAACDRVLHRRHRRAAGRKLAGGSGGLRFGLLAQERQQARSWDAHAGRA